MNNPAQEMGVFSLAYILCYYSAELIASAVLCMELDGQEVLTVTTG